MKKFLMLLGMCAGLSFASMIGLEALGEENVLGGTASAAGRGFAGGAKAGDAEGLSVVNPARLAFDTKVVFNLNFLVEMDQASKDGDQFSVNKLSLPSLNLSFPMGVWGAMGLSLWQHYSSTLKEEDTDVKSESDFESERKRHPAAGIGCIKLRRISSVKLAGRFSELFCPGWRCLGFG